MRFDHHAIRAQTPFQYQLTEFDCVLSTCLNALRYLFPRETIPPEAMIIINRLAMDKTTCWNDDESVIRALNEIVDWLSNYRGKGRYKRFKVKAQILQNQEVTPETIGKYLRRGDAAAYMGVSTSKNYADDHAMLAILQNTQSVYLFDSYLSTEKSIKKRRQYEAKGLEFYPGTVTSYNLSVPISHLFSGPVNDDWYYRLGDQDSRFCILFERTN